MALIYTKDRVHPFPSLPLPPLSSFLFPVHSLSLSFPFTLPSTFFFPSSSLISFLELEDQKPEWSNWPEPDDCLDWSNYAWECNLIYFLKQCYLSLALGPETECPPYWCSNMAWILSYSIGKSVLFSVLVWATGSRVDQCYFTKGNHFSFSFSFHYFMKSF